MSILIAEASKLGGKISMIKQAKTNHFWNFAGLSLWTVSVGLSIAIIRTDNLNFGSNEANLSLAKKAYKINNKVAEVENKLTEIVERQRESSEKVEAKKTISEITKTRGEIEKLVDNNEE